MQIIVAGFHRSGTSLLTQLLHRAGLFVGDDLLGAPGRPHGQYEDREFLRLHRAILGRHGQDWQWDRAFPFHIGRDHWNRMTRLARERDTAHHTWGFKDPRVCLLLGPWKHVLPDAKVVMVYRDPAECVRSFQERQAPDHVRHPEPLGADRRDGRTDHLRFAVEPEHVLRLWNTYNRALVNFARGHLDDCLVVPHGELVGGRPVVAQAAERFGARLRPAALDGADGPGYPRSASAAPPVADDDLARRVRQTWDDLDDLAARTAC